MGPDSTGAQVRRNHWITAHTAPSAICCDDYLHGSKIYLLLVAPKAFERDAVDAGAIVQDFEVTAEYGLAGSVAL